MGVSSGFFNSEKGTKDRVYDADQVGSMFDGLIEDGVYQNYGDAFNILVGPGNFQVTVKSGRAWYMHTWILNDGDLVLNVNPAALVNKRTDMIVLDIDKRRSVRENTIKYISGQSLINSEDHKQIPLARINVPEAATKLNQQDIEYLVGTSECPIVTGILQTLNIDNVLQQFSDEFYLWFNGLQDIMDENTAGKIMNELMSLRTRVDANTAQINRLVKEVFDPANGQNLGSSLTAQQKEAIRTGSFAGLYPGDYWTINGVKWYIIDYDYYMRYTPHDSSVPACTKHHLVVMPEKTFAIDRGTLDLNLKIANKNYYSDDATYVLRTRGKGNVDIVKTYYYTESMKTSSNFDWEHPGTEARNFAAAAWGDNLIPVPDVFGDISSFYTDFHWETVTDGTLIPHYLDMKIPTIGASSITYGWSDDNGTVGRTSSELDTYYLSFTGSMPAKYAYYQNADILTEDNRQTLFYTNWESPCRTYLAQRFTNTITYNQSSRQDVIAGGGYMVQPDQLPASFASCLPSYNYSLKTCLYLKDLFATNDYDIATGKNEAYSYMVLPYYEDEVKPRLQAVDLSGDVQLQDPYDSLVTFDTRQVLGHFVGAELNTRLITYCSVIDNGNMKLELLDENHQPITHTYDGFERDKTFLDSNPRYIHLKETGGMTITPSYPIVCCIGG